MSSMHTAQMQSQDPALDTLNFLQISLSAVLGDKLGVTPIGCHWYADKAGIPRSVPDLPLAIQNKPRLVFLTTDPRSMRLKQSSGSLPASAEHLLVRGRCAQRLELTTLI